MKTKELKIFIINFVGFIFPILVLFLIGNVCYTKSDGDLSRLGKIAYPEDYRDVYLKEFNEPQLWVDFSDLDSVTGSTFDVLIIGDSFSNIYENNYQNFLEQMGNTVLNFDSYNYKIEGYQPINMLGFFLNSDVLDSIKVDIIVLQMVERTFVDNVMQFDIERNGLPYNSFNKLEKAKIIKLNKEVKTVRTLVNDVILFYRYGFFYQFNDHAFDAPVYKFEMRDSLFEVIPNQLLCIEGDINNIYSVTTKRMELVEAKLSLLKAQLNKRGIQLIVLPAPDKYDLYCDYIKDNRHQPNPFFDYLEEFSDSTLVVNSKALFMPHLKKGIKDIYFADDTHWSPKGAKIIAKHIDSLIKNIN